MQQTLSLGRLPRHDVRCVNLEHSFSNCDRILVLFPYVCKHVCKNKLIDIRLWEIDIRSVSSTWLPHFGMSYVFVFANVTTWSMQINQNFIVNHFLRCWVRHFTEGNVLCDGTGIYGWTIKQDRKVATNRLIEQAVVKFYYLSTSLLQLFLRFFFWWIALFHCYFKSIFKWKEVGLGYSFAGFDSVVIFGV